jgi:hypothetical protein
MVEQARAMLVEKVTKVVDIERYRKCRKVRIKVESGKKSIHMYM